MSDFDFPTGYASIVIYNFEGGAYINGMYSGDFQPTQECATLGLERLGCVRTCGLRVVAVARIRMPQASCRLQTVFRNVQG